MNYGPSCSESLTKLQSNVRWDHCQARMDVGRLCFYVPPEVADRMGSPVAYSRSVLGASLSSLSLGPWVAACSIRMGKCQ